LQAASAVQAIRMMMVYLEGEHARRAMPSGVFKTADGWLQFLVVRNSQWIGLCGVLEMPALASDPRFVDDDARVRNETELMGILRAVIAERSTAYWSMRLEKADIMHERLNSLREFVAHPQAEAINLFTWLQLANVPERVPVPNIAGIAPRADGTPRAMMPTPGQHTRVVLQEHGYNRDEIAGLMSRNVIAAA
jgi:crotonobetainyl-CoA:carnitine CoA-transferase CaiB-like acyl-CoA transferase